MADKNFKIGATLEVNDNQIKSEFTKAGELAGEAVAKGLENKSGDIQGKLAEEVDNMKAKLEELQNLDLSIEVNMDNAEAWYNTFQDEMIEAHNTVTDFGNALREAGEDGGDVYEQLKDVTDEYRDALAGAQGEVEKLASGLYQTMQDAEAQTKETTEAVRELNETANQGISENGGLGKMLKFLTSKQIFNFFYRNLKQIGETLIELSGEAENLTKKFEPVKQKLEDIGGYLGQGLVPVVETAIDEISSMADELMKTGSDGSTALQLVQKGIYWLGQAFLAVGKVIRTFGQLIGNEVANWWVLIDAFWRDFYDTAKSVIEGIGDASNWEALGNNIKYGILKGVNEAIGGINKMLRWMDSKLGIDLGEIKTIGTGQKQSFSFGEFDFTRTKNALLNINQANQDLLKEIGSEWSDFWDNAKQGAKDLESTVIKSNKKIKDNTDDTVGGGGSKKKDSVKSVYEQLEEEAKDIREEMTSLVEEHQKSYDKLTEEIEKVGEQYDKLRDEAKKTWEEAEKSLSDYNDELSKSQLNTIQDLGQRYVELKKDLIGVDEWMKKVAQDLTMDEAQRLSDIGYTEYMGYDIKKLLDIKDKLDELKLIEENTTEEQRKSNEFTKEISKTQEILNKQKEKELELEGKKAAALEKQAIAQAVIAQGNGKQYIQTVEGRGTYYYDAVKKQWQLIQNEDNVQYAKQLENQVENLNDQLEQYKQAKNEEVDILINTTARKIELENEFQKVFEENVKKQEKELDNLILKEQQLIDKKREYMTLSGTLHNAYGGSVLSGQASIVGENGPEQIIARQSSYIQPRNAGNSYSTVNNSNSLNINGIEIGNFNTVDDMLDALKERLTYRS